MYILVGDDLVLYDKHELSALYDQYELSAPICITAEDIVFPYPEYSDFLYPVLCNWADILIGHTNSQTARYELRFLGSGYQISIQQDRTKMLELEFRYAVKRLGSIRLPYDALLSAVCGALVDFRSNLYRSELNTHTDLSDIIKKVSISIQSCKAVLNQ